MKRKLCLELNMKKLKKSHHYAITLIEHVTEIGHEYFTYSMKYNLIFVCLWLSV